jgi:eukaryotic-like serine/threonine-protein kinase
MSIDCITTFLTVLRRTQLLAQEQVEEVARELVPHYADASALGEYLVQIDWLTAFQLQLLLIGRWDELTVGPYQILDRLGEGGVSEVFKAWDTVRGRTVALKVLRQHLATKSDVVRQFQRELQVITRLSHPNIIKTFDAHNDAQVCYFAMEFVEGMDLERYVREVGPLSVEQACDYARQVAQGLQHAHQLGLVHRDIKPANLFLLHPPLPTAPGVPAKRGPDAVVKVIDWGLARCMRDANEDGSTPELSTEELEAEKGSLVGTADYIAPEQAQNPTLVDIRADIYSLGCAMYYLLTGRPPFQGTSLMQKLMQHQETPPEPIRHERPDVPEELSALIHKMLQKAPADRPQIPLLVVTPLRRFCMSLVAAGGSSMNGTRPSSAPSLTRPGLAPGTALNLPRPATHGALARPSTNTNLPRPGANGAVNGHH